MLQGIEMILSVHLVSRLHSIKASMKRQLAWWLVALMLVSEGVYVGLVQLDATNGWRPVLLFLGCMALLFAMYGIAFLVVRRQPNQRGTLWWVAAGAMLFRLTLLPVGLSPRLSLLEKVEAMRADWAGESVEFERFLLFDHDIWRYLWDGHVWASGVNPFMNPPMANGLDSLAEADDLRAGSGAIWSDIRRNINYPDTPTIYPPLAQGVFRLSHFIAPGSVLAMKLLLVAFDLLAVWFVAQALTALGRPASWAVLYAWNPLVIKTIAASGHMDSIVAAALAATALFLVRRRNGLAACGFACAVLAKAGPIILLPFLVRRLPLRFVALSGALILAGFLPFLDAGTTLFDGFRAFAQGWQFNAGPFVAVRWILASFIANPSAVARVVCALGLLATLMWLRLRDDGRRESFPAISATALGTMVVLSPAVMPWYLIWLLPLAVISVQRTWLFFSALVCLAFLVMVDQQESAWILAIEYGVILPLWLRDITRSFTPAVSGVERVSGVSVGT
ncbi:MAG: hypothetical protein L0387_36360 [Acidobacteria bacterium]|nr:hypothetical protein [Acidobacteriota bacterium]